MHSDFTFLWYNVLGLLFFRTQCMYFINSTDNLIKILIREHFSLYQLVQQCQETCLNCKPKLQEKTNQPTTNSYNKHSPTFTVICILRKSGNNEQWPWCRNKSGDRFLKRHSYDIVRNCALLIVNCCQLTTENILWQTVPNFDYSVWAQLPAPITDSAAYSKWHQHAIFTPITYGMLVFMS